MALSQDKRAIDAYVSKDLKEFLASKAKEEGLSMSTLAGDALLQYAKSQGFQETANLDDAVIEQARTNRKWGMQLVQQILQTLAETPTKCVFGALTW